MKYLVTGHHGFLGRLFVDKLIDKHKEPVLIEGDLLEDGKLDNVCDENYLIIHFAGYKDEDPKLNKEKNVDLTKKLVNLADKDSHCEGMIYISSIAVIGRVDSSSEFPITPNSPCNPVKNYGDAKLKCERVVQKLTKDYWIVRPTNIVDGLKHGAFSEMECMFKRGEAYHLFDVRKNKLRDYITVKDVIDSIYYLVAEPKRLPDDNKIIILGSGHSYSFEEAVNLFREKIEPGLQVEITPPDKALADANIVVDAYQTRALLGREPETLGDELERVKKENE